MIDGFLSQLTRQLGDRWHTPAPAAHAAGVPLRLRRAGVLPQQRLPVGAGRALGYDPVQRTLLALEPRGDDVLAEARPALEPAPARRAALPPLRQRGVGGQLQLAGVRRRAQRRRRAAVVLRRLPAQPRHPGPDPRENRRDWGLIEQAKRRLVSQLLALGLPVRSRLAGAGGEDTAHGLAFDFLRPLDGQPVLTGHAGGIVTLNVDEADDPTRERIRASLREPYRTLLGHLRHEVGPLLLGSAGRPAGAGLAEFRTVLRRRARRLRRGAGAALPARSGTGLGAVACQRLRRRHPWLRTWAEEPGRASLADLVDALDTGLSSGSTPTMSRSMSQMFEPEVLTRRTRSSCDLVNAWVELTALLNEMSRSMGVPDFYPFVLMPDGGAQAPPGASHRHAPQRRRTERDNWRPGPPQLVEGLRRHRPAVEPALRQLAAQLAQAAGLRLGLDALGDQRRAPGCGRARSMRARWRRVGARRACRAMKERSIFSVLIGKRLQVGQRRVAGAEVVDRQARGPVARSSCSVALRALVVAHQHRLGDLQLERTAGRSRCAPSSARTVVQQVVVTNWRGDRLTATRSVRRPARCAQAPPRAQACSQHPVRRSARSGRCPRPAG